MIRISKLTDYGIVLLTHFARVARDERERTFSARELADDSDIPLPTVGKLLKILSKAELLESQRGTKGGYRLIRKPESITAAEIISFIEGPIALSDCTEHPCGCERARTCSLKSSWHKINKVVLQALESLTLDDILRQHKEE